MESPKTKPGPATPRTACSLSGTSSGGRCRPDATSHSLIELSELPDARVLPSGVKAREDTPPWCPVRTSRSAPAREMSQSLTVRSPLPDASVRPPSRNATEDTRFEWLFSVVHASPVATTHSLTVLEFDAARYRPSGEKD